MDDIAANVLSRFGIGCKSVKKVKSVFVCATERGLLAVETARVDSERLLFALDATNRLLSQGFTDIETYYTTPDGLPYTAYEDETYFVRSHINARETNFGDAKEFARALPVIGRMHEIWAASPSYDGFAEDSDKEIEERYAVDAALLARVKKRAYRNKPLSDFDVEVIRRFDFYMNRLEAWRSAATSARVAKNNRDAANGGGICHGALKEEHVLYDGAKVHITGFSTCGPGYYNSDLSDMLLRHLREGGRMPIGKAAKLYLSDTKDMRGNIKDLTARMLYPARFLSLIARVYEKRRSWLPATFAEKLSAIVATDEALVEYLRN